MLNKRHFWATMLRAIITFSRRVPRSTMRIKMSRLTLAVTVTAVAAVLAGCGSSATPAGEASAAAGSGSGSGSASSGAVIPVVASTNVWGDIVKQVGGEYVDVVSVIADP